HAAFDEPPRQEQLAADRGFTVPLANFLRFATQIEDISGFRLHAEGQFERADAGFELRIISAILEVFVVERCNEVELLALLIEWNLCFLYIPDDFINLCMLAIDICALIYAGQKRGSPVLRGNNRIPAGAHDHEPRQVAVLAAEPVSHPATETRPRLPPVAA